MKKISYCILLMVAVLVLFPALDASAQNYGISGLASLTYDQAESSNEDETIEKSRFEQDYRIRYRNFLYSPRLLDYTFMGRFIKDDAESNGQTTEMDSEDYSIALNFLSLTNHPFNILAERTTSESLGALESGTTLSEQRIQRYLLDGSWKSRRPYLPALRYKVSQHEVEHEGTGDPKDERTRNLLLNLRKKWARSMATLNYSYKNTMDRLVSSEETMHSLRLDAETRRSLARHMTLLATGSYNSDLDETSSVKAMAKIDYTPSARFGANAKSVLEHTMDPEGTGDSLSNSLKADYRFSRKLRGAAGSRFMINSGTFGESTSESVNGSMSFNDRLSNSILYSLAGASGFTASQGGDQNVTAWSGSGNSTIQKLFPAIRTNASLSASASYSNNSLGDSSHEYKVALDAASNAIRRLTLETNNAYTVRKTGAGSPYDSYKTSNSARYFMFFGFRARLNLKASYTLETSSEAETDTQTLIADANLRYVLRRNLSLEATSRYENYLTESETTLSNEAVLNYSIRRISITMKYGYTNSESESSSSTVNYTYLNITRSF